MTNIAEQLINGGAKVWEKGDMKRIYPTWAQKEQLMRVEKVYNKKILGKIDDYMVNGNRISNTKQNTLNFEFKGPKFYYDAKTGEWSDVVKGLLDYYDLDGTL